MGRRRPDHRLADILEAATSVFIDQGFRRTQMADVATALGVAKGTLYLYVESKEALFDAALRYVDAGSTLPQPDALPLSTPAAGTTLAYVRDELATQSRLASLEAAIAGPHVEGIEAEASAIFVELYATLARNRRRLKLLDSSARDYPEIAALWFEGARGGLLSVLEAWLADRRARELLTVEGDTAVTARLLLETLVFWAVHRHWDLPSSGDGNGAVEEGSARDTVIGFLVRSLVPRAATTHATTVGAGSSREPVRPRRGNKVQEDPR